MKFLFEMSFEEFLDANNISCTCHTGTRRVHDNTPAHKYNCAHLEWRKKWSAEGKTRYEDMKKRGLFAQAVKVEYDMSA